MSDYEIAAEQRREIVRQIGAGNLMAISGGRTLPIKGGVSLPVSAGYHVHVELEPNDTYTVTRWFARCGKFHQHGQVANVYAEQVGQVAYRASCHESYSDGEWVR